jgi:hypothetical protein
MAEAHMNAAPATQPRPRGLARLRAAWRTLEREQRMCGAAALALVVTMFLPWYSTSRGVPIPGQGARLVEDNESAIAAFSWVEAAVLLVALGVLAMLFARGERRAFHLPGGDGTVIAGAGLWACLLIVWRLFDKPELGQGVSVGLQWGIFVALAAAIALTAAGNRLRAARRPEPPLVQAPPPRDPGEPVEVRIPDVRPHLEQTNVMRRPPAADPGPDRPLPLSRAQAAQDTAEFRAVPQTPAAEEREEPSEERTEPLPEERTEPLPAGPEEETTPLGRPEDERTDPLPRDRGEDEG